MIKLTVVVNFRVDQCFLVIRVRSKGHRSVHDRVSCPHRAEFQTDDSFLLEYIRERTERKIT